VDQKLQFGASALAKIDSQLQFCFSNHLPLLPFLYKCPPWLKNNRVVVEEEEENKLRCRELIRN